MSDTVDMIQYFIDFKDVDGVLTCFTWSSEKPDLEPCGTIQENLDGYYCFFAWQANSMLTVECLREIMNKTAQLNNKFFC